MGRKLIIKDADFSEVAVASNAIPVTALVISGGDSAQDVRQVQLGVFLTPVNTTQRDVVWSIVSGDATIDNNGLLTYSGPANGTVVVRVQSAKNSSVSAQKTITFALPSVEAPTFLPVGGSYNAAQNVVVSCATAGATIYYTTDGTTPTTSSQTISSGGSISVGESMTLKAFAVKDGVSSTVSVAEYAITLMGALTVVVTDENDDVVTGAEVTLDGNLLTEQGNGIYTGQFVQGSGKSLQVSKFGFLTNTQTISIGESTNISVQLSEDPALDLIEAQEAFILNGHSVTITAANQTYFYNGRSSLAILRSKATVQPVFQRDDSNGTTSANYSYLEWPMTHAALVVKFTKGTPNWAVSTFTNASAYVFNTGWKSAADTLVLKRSDGHANSFFVAFSFKDAVSGMDTPAKLKNYGVSIIAYKTEADIPNQ